MREEIVMKIKKIYNVVFILGNWFRLICCFRFCDSVCGVLDRLVFFVGVEVVWFRSFLFGFYFRNFSVSKFFLI